MRGQEKWREATLFRADGVVIHDKNIFPEHTRTPSAALRWASPTFISAAATPPRRGGEIRLIRFSSISVFFPVRSGDLSFQQGRCDFCVQVPFIHLSSALIITH